MILYYGIISRELFSIPTQRLGAADPRYEGSQAPLQFQDYLSSKAVSDVDDEDAVRFLTWLATHKQARHGVALRRRMVSTTQNQAFNALLFLFRHVLKRPYELGDKVKRARRTKYVPVVLSREEVDKVFSRMEDPHHSPVSF